MSKNLIKENRMSDLSTTQKTYVDYPQIRMVTDAASPAILKGTTWSVVVRGVDSTGMLVYEKESEDKILIDAIPDGVALAAVVTLVVAEMPIDPTTIVTPVTE